ncbi:MAG: HAMP domain-containing histidine kinase [Pseudobdellovibrionaceae bacterium]|nr:MAG: HAMP domain-containing histidine kinase [Pseudobdellovibrionaceae bacterium]
MARRTYRSILVLRFLRTFWAPILAAFIGIVSVEIAFFYFNDQYEESVWKSVKVLLRDEVEMTNSYQLSRTLSDMEKEDWITCVSLKEVVPYQRVYYETTYKDQCTSGRKQSGTLQSINGTKWQLEFVPQKNIWLAASHNLMRVVLAGVILVLTMHYHRKNKKIELEKKAGELEKQFLLDLTSQTRHDVASPLTAIKTVSQVANIDEKFKDLLDQALKRVESIFQDLSRATRGANDVRQNGQAFCLRELMAEIQSEKESSWQFKVNFVAEGPALKVCGNKMEFSRVISNLLNNAMDAMLDVDQKIIRWTLSEQSSKAILVIQDCGRGMPPDIMRKAGQKGFSYGKENISSSGSGLGLYHSIQTVNAMRGTFELESDIGVGTRITITLPLA